MAVAVSNASPICNLARIGRLHLLSNQFREIRIPSAVQEELSRLSDRVAGESIETAIRDGWIKPLALRNETVARLLQATLHRGESEAIALALESAADLILLDEKDAREAARRAGLRAIGVLGILLRAKRDGDIVALKPEIEALRSRARFFVSSALEQKVIEAAGE